MNQNDFHDDLTSIAESRPVLVMDHEQLLSVPKEMLTENASRTEQRSRRKTANWRLLASFAVEIQARSVGNETRVYRTTAHHMETDKDAMWPGIEGKKLCAWMLGQLGEDAEVKVAEDASNKAEPAMEVPVTMSVTQVLAFQPPRSQTPVAIGKPGHLFQGVLAGGLPFTLEADFQLASPVSEHSAHETDFYAQFVVSDLVTGAKTTLGTSATGTLVAGQTAYKARLPDIYLASGLYQIRVVVSLHHALRGVALLEVPLFRLL